MVKLVLLIVDLHEASQVFYYFTTINDVPDII